MNNKDVIYVDVEDEITGIIDKVNSSKSKVVALVLPKRATVFQSVVNMKLLKKKATDSKKTVVLVTSEAGLMPLAGAVGVHVAKTLEAKPEIPEGPDGVDEEPVDVDDEQTDDEELDKSKPIGELAGAAAVGAAVARNKQPEEDDTIEFDNDKVEPAAAGAAAAAGGAKAAKKPKKGKDKKLKVPDFNKFRKILIIGALSLIALIVLFILAAKILPKATVIIQTNTQTANTNLTVTLDSSATTVNTTSFILPARLQTVQKTSTSTAVNTTGSKQVGTSATGTVTVTNSQAFTNSYTISAGTEFVDPSGNYIFTSNSDETVPASSCTVHACSSSSKYPSVNIPVTASQVGSGYNIPAASNYSSNDPNLKSYSISGSAMSGGSSQTVQVVAQADINSAQTQLTAPSTSTIQTQLETSLKSAGFIPMTGSFVAGTPTYTPSAAAGTQANSVTVTENVTYTMYGVTQANLDTLITSNVNQQINTSQQSILDTGATGATFTLSSSTATSVQGTLNATSTIGPKLGVTAIKLQVAGQRSGDIKSELGSIPGVTNVIVKYSPFWVTSTPKNTSKITIVIQKANGSTP